MFRNLKVLALAIMAPFALSAMAASAASAAEFTSFNTANSTHESGTFSGAQAEGSVHKITAGTGVGSVTCEVAKFNGSSASGTDATPTVIPTYENCHILVLGVTYKIHFSMNGCDYRYHVSGGGGDVYTGTTDIECPAGQEIDVKITKSVGEETKCTIKWPAQTGMNGLTFENNTGSSPTDLRLATTTNNIKTTTSGGIGGCGIADGPHTNGTYTGETTLKAFNTKSEQIDLTIM